LSHPSRLDWRTLLVGGLVAAGVALLGWYFLPEIRRRAVHFQLPSFGRTATANGPRMSEVAISGVAPAQKEIKASPRFVGGPRQISLRLNASEPSLRRAVVPIGKPARMIPPPVEPGIEGNGEP